MPLKIMREITHWKDLERQPNHVYLIDGDRVYAYVKWGQGKPFYFKTFLRLDRRGRRFEEVERNSWQFDLQIDTQTEVIEPPKGQTWQITGSKGNTYTVSLADGIWNCSCPGHSFRGRCRHVDELKAPTPQPV